jgi:hypothetical protein
VQRLASNGEVDAALGLAQGLQRGFRVWFRRLKKGYSGRVKESLVGGLEEGY